MDRKELFATLRNDPALLTIQQFTRTAGASSELCILLTELTRGWTPDMRASLAACLALLPEMPSARFSLETQAFQRGQWQSEVDLMDPKVRFDFPALLLMRLEHEDALREVVELAFCRIHRAVRTYRRPPPS